jgi:hypothetical protein
VESVGATRWMASKTTRMGSLRLSRSPCSGQFANGLAQVLGFLGQEPIWRSASAARPRCADQRVIRLTAITNRERSPRGKRRSSAGDEVLRQPELLASRRTPDEFRVTPDTRRASGTRNSWSRSPTDPRRCSQRAARRGVDGRRPCVVQHHNAVHRALQQEGERSRVRAAPVRSSAPVLAAERAAKISKSDTKRGPGQWLVSSTERWPMHTAVGVQQRCAEIAYQFSGLRSLSPGYSSTLSVCGSRCAVRPPAHRCASDAIP